MPPQKNSGTVACPHYKGSTIPGFEEHIKVKDNDLIIKPKALDITWGGDNRYWRITEDAELVQVSWLEVNGTVEMRHLKPDKKYKLQFRVRLKPDAFGWNDSPVYIMVRPGKGRYIWKNADLSQIKESTTAVTIPFSLLEFTTAPASEHEKVTFGLYEIWKGRWKGGLVIEEVVISPI